MYISNCAWVATCLCLEYHVCKKEKTKSQVDGVIVKIVSYISYALSNGGRGIIGSFHHGWVSVERLVTWWVRPSSTVTEYPQGIYTSTRHEREVQTTIGFYLSATNNFLRADMLANKDTAVSSFALRELSARNSSVQWKTLLLEWNRFI